MAVRSRRRADALDFLGVFRMAKKLPLNINHDAAFRRAATAGAREVIRSPEFTNKVSDAVKSVLGEYAEAVGIDLSTKEGREDLRDHIDYVRAQRNAFVSARSKGIATIVVIMVTGLAYAFWNGFISVLAQLANRSTH